MLRLLPKTEQALPGRRRPPLDGTAGAGSTCDLRAPGAGVPPVLRGTAILAIVHRHDFLHIY